MLRIINLFEEKSFENKYLYLRFLWWYFLITLNFETLCFLKLFSFSKPIWNSVKLKSKKYCVDLILCTWQLFGRFVNILNNEYWLFVMNMLVLMFNWDDRFLIGQKKILTNNRYFLIFKIQNLAYYQITERDAKDNRVNIYFHLNLSL